LDRIGPNDRRNSVLFFSRGLGRVRNALRMRERTHDVAIGVRHGVTVLRAFSHAPPGTFYA